MREIQREEGQDSDLCRVSFCCCHSDLRSGIGVQHRIGKFRYGTSHHIDDPEDPRTEAFTLLYRGDRIGRLTGLGNGDDEGVFIHDRIDSKANLAAHPA